MRLGILAVFALVGCAEETVLPGDLPPSSLPPSETLETERFELTNSGEAAREGHTPRGFEGQGGGLFTGDDINPNFPAGDGVQIFLTLPLDDALAGRTVETAMLSAEPTEIRGTPFQDLGALRLDEMRFMQFSSALWDREPIEGGFSCDFATSVEGPFECDIADAVQRAIDAERDAVQLRLRLETAGDSDGAPDLVMFYGSDSNATTAGLFELSVDAMVP